MDDKDQEISQVSFFLAKPENTFDTVLDAEAKPEEHDEFSQLEIEVGGASCRFIYFETTSHKKNPKWLTLNTVSTHPRLFTLINSALAAAVHYDRNIFT